MALFSTKKAPPAEYYPAWGGNRESPTEDQWGVEIEPMTAGEIQAQREALSRGIRGGAQANAAKAGAKFRNAIVETHAKRLVGRPIEVDTDAGPIAVTSGKQLVTLAAQANDGAPDDLLDELYKAITDQSFLAEGVRKNS